VALGGAWWVHSLGPVPRGETLDHSTLVVDREGRLLRPYATGEGRWRLPATLEHVDRRYVDMLLAYEDRRFRSHPGVDLLAMGRAALQFVTSGRIVSGGSTITMQVARLLEPRTERSVGAKLRQMVRAIQLERVLTKDEVLGLYLSLAPYGGNLEGIRAASLSYFAKEPRRLSMAEAALLVALPQSPEVRRPDRSVAAARAARDRVLDRIALTGRIPADEVALAKLDGVPNGRKPMPVLAPHAAEQAIATAPTRKIHRLTIDAPLQKSLQDLARERARPLGPDISVAIIVVDHGTGEVLARVASADFFDERRAGQVDMTQALRSPGSALKPFIYGLAFEDGLVHPETLIEDRPVRYGAYAPENFDMTFQGTVSARRALQLSLNVPAVALLDKVGASRLSARLAQAGAPLVLPKGEAPGLAMALGGVGVKLSDLTMLYAGLARGGMALPLTERVDDRTPGAPLRLIDPVAAWYVGNVLTGSPPPEHAAGGRIAYKTGTSYGFRDAWAIGYDSAYTVGVWVGRPDGSFSSGRMGRDAAAPVLFEVFDMLPRPQGLPSVVFAAKPPAGALQASNADLPLPLRRFDPGPSALDALFAGGGPQIAFPADRATVDLGAGDGPLEPLLLRANGGRLPLLWLVNGVPVASSPFKRQAFYQPDGAGATRITVIDSAGASASAEVWIQ
jgi:penicillin-binding protein 1C